MTGGRRTQIRLSRISADQRAVLSVLYDGGTLIWRCTGRRANGALTASHWYTAPAGTPHPDDVVDPTGLDRFGWWQPGHGQSSAWSRADGRAVKGLLSKGLLEPVLVDQPTPRGRAPVQARAGARITPLGRQTVEEERTGRVDRRTRESRARASVEETTRRIAARGVRVAEVIDALKSQARVVEIIQAAYQAAGGPPMPESLRAVLAQAVEVCDALQGKGVRTGEGR